MASRQKSGSLRPVPELVDLYPTQARAVADFAMAVCQQHRGTKKAADAIAMSPHGLAGARLARTKLRQPTSVINALAAYAGCAVPELLAGRATLPALTAPPPPAEGASAWFAPSQTG